MSKLLIFLSVLIVYICYIETGLCDNDRSSGLDTLDMMLPAASLSKNVRILSPAGVRLFKLLRKETKEDDVNTEDENYFKKRGYDDYGHMRFGKRNQPKDFDDYGHMRFGK